MQSKSIRGREYGTAERQRTVLYMLFCGSMIMCGGDVSEERDRDDQTNTNGFMILGIFASDKSASDTEYVSDTGLEHGPW